MFEEARSPLDASIPIASRLAAHADPAQLYEWIRLAAGPAPKPNLLSRATRRVTRLEPAVLQALLLRANPLVDLAVATYADDNDALEELWRRDDDALRLAIAGNRHRPGLVGLDLMDLLRSDNQELVDLALANPSMSSPALARVLERGHPLDQLSDDEWLRGVRAIARSPVIRLKRSWFDFGSDDWVVTDVADMMPSGEACAAAWRLPHMLEPTETNAELLEALLGAVAEFSPPVSEFGWKPESADSGPQGHRAASQRFVRAMLRKWKRGNARNDAPTPTECPLDFHHGVRVVISAAAATQQDFPDDELRLSDDHATRLGYYRAGQKWTADQVRAAFDLDGVDFLREIVGNDVVHGSAELRDAVEDCIHRVGGSTEASKSSSQTQQELTETWRAVGRALWRENRFLYPGPSGRSRMDDRERGVPVGLVETLERMAENTYDDFVCDNVWLRDVEKTGRISQTQSARVSFDATWRLARAMFSALKPLSHEIEGDRQHRRDVQDTIEAIRTALWLVGAVVVTAALIDGFKHWF